jgi:predicted RNA-binding protein with PUA-like domain
MNYWLFKTEPSSYSIDDLKRDGTTYWDGIRNYQARNLIRDDMKVGDGVLVYHSNAEPTAIVGLAKIVRAGYPDHTQFEAGHVHFDATAKLEEPRWYMVDIAFERAFAKPLTLAALKELPALKDMGLLRKGNRLSVQPVTEKEWKEILSKGR